MSTTGSGTTGHIVADRLPGPDVVRAVALIGVVVMNYHGYLIISADPSDSASGVGNGWAANLFDPWSGPLSTRFAATFVVVAGIGVTLLTRSVVGDPTRTTAMRWRLARRGVLLYTVGVLVDLIWPGTILPYYGAMFVVAAMIFTLRSRWIIVIGLTATVAGGALHAWIFWRTDHGHDTNWLTFPGNHSVRGRLLDVAVNGAHPLLPWLAFLCSGMLIARAFPTRRWRHATIAVGATLFALAALIGSWAATPFQRVVLSTHPDDASLVYFTSALGTSMLAYASIDWLAERFSGPVDPLRRAGQLTLTLYLGHVLVFNLLVDWLGWIEPAGLDVALTFALGFWIVAIAAAVLWQRRFGIGPAERFYRAFSG